MIFEAIERVLRGLNEAGVRYLVAGGMAVNAHGYQRLTKDLDLVLDLNGANVLVALEALGDLGFEPVVPVSPAAFADPEARARWHAERNMEVFGLRSGEVPALTVDLFVRIPFSFENAYEQAHVEEIAPGLEVPFVALDELIRMKEAAGRPRDLDDVQHLRWIRNERKSDE